MHEVAAYTDTTVAAHLNASDVASGKAPSFMTHVTETAGYDGSPNYSRIHGDSNGICRG